MKQGSHILIVHDHRLFNESVAVLIKGQQDIALIETATTPREALEKIEALSIDIVLINANISRTDSILLTREVNAEFPGLKIVIFGLEQNEERILEFIEAGVSGYVLRDSSF